MRRGVPIVRIMAFAVVRDSRTARCLVDEIVEPGSGRAGDTLVVTKLDRLARSLPDVRAISEDLTCRMARLSLGGSVYDPTDPVGRLLSNVVAMVAEFEADDGAREIAEELASGHRRVIPARPAGKRRA